MRYLGRLVVVWQSLIYTSDAGYLFVGRPSSSDYSFITTEDDTFNFLSFLKISISLKTPKIQFHNEKKNSEQSNHFLKPFIEMHPLHIRHVKKLQMFGRCKCAWCWDGLDVKSKIATNTIQSRQLLINLGAI